MIQIDENLEELIVAYLDRSLLLYLLINNQHKEIRDEAVLVSS